MCSQLASYSCSKAGTNNSNCAATKSRLKRSRPCSGIQAQMTTVRWECESWFSSHSKPNMSATGTILTSLSSLHANTTRCRCTSHTWLIHSTSWLTDNANSACFCLRTRHAVSVMTTDYHRSILSKSFAAPCRPFTSLHLSNSHSRLPPSKKPLTLTGSPA